MHKALNIKPGKKGRKLIHSTSGDVVAVKRDRVIKFFLGGNEVHPAGRFGRRSLNPPKNHYAIKYYAELMNSKPARTQNERIYGSPPPATYHVRAPKLIREGSRYHVVERINGPNLLDFIHFAESGKGPRLREESPLLESKKEDNEVRRKGLADLLKRNKKEFLEWKPKRREFMNELYDQMNWMRSAHEGMIDIYGHQMKETDFIVEGIEKDKDGKLRLKLVLVDFK